MVRINVQVARASQLQVAHGVLGEGREHVIKEADARVDVRLALAIYVQTQGDAGFRGDAPDGRCPFPHGPRKANPPPPHQP